MGQEIDLLRNYPRTTRNVEERGNTKSDMDRIIARQFGKEFFDGDRKHGYGGFNYNARYWSTVVCDIQDHFNIKSYDSILDVGCAKGFMLFDFFESIYPRMHFLSMCVYDVTGKQNHIRILLVNQVYGIVDFLWVVEAPAVNVGYLRNGKTIKSIWQIGEKYALFDYLVVVFSYGFAIK